MSQPAYVLKQRGATLLVALVMLIVMTLLGLASIRSTSMQEKMGANLYDRSLAFQAVESALREAESGITISTLLAMGTQTGLYCPATYSGSRCTVHDSTATFVERWDDSATVWAPASTWWGTVDADMKARLGGNNARPEYIIEYMGDFEDGTGCGRRGSTSCKGPRYRITARMPATEGKPAVALQTTYRP